MKNLLTAMLLVSAFASAALASDAASVNCKNADGSTSQVATADDCTKAGGTVAEAAAH